MLTTLVEVNAQSSVTSAQLLWGWGWEGKEMGDTMHYDYRGTFPQINSGGMGTNKIRLQHVCCALRNLYGQRKGRGVV